MRLILSILLAMQLTQGLGQGLLNDSIFALPDTVNPLTIENFYRLIVENHPVVKQASLLPDYAKQEIRLARGAFDPKVEASFLLKHYNNTEYYRLFDGAVKLPTRSPVTPVVGIERSKGQYINPENYISPEFNYQQMYAGISIPLGQGLLTDDRRVALRQAELFGELMEAEQVKLINKFLLDAAKDYWEWYARYYNYRLAIATAEIAEEIFSRVRTSFEGGELAPIDTVQAKIIFLERQVARQEAFAAWRNQSFQLSNYMWDEQMNPLELTSQFVPVGDIDIMVLSSTTLDELIELANENHPDLRKLTVKIEQLENDNRLAREYLKPRMQLSYYMLNQPFSPEGWGEQIDLYDNYKFGADFAFPLFLRKERAKVAQTRLKITTSKFDLDLAQRQVVNEIRSAHNQLLNIGIVLRQQREMVDNYQRLMRAELLNLENGESDLFKINVQQEKLFNAQTKLVKTIADYEKQKAILYWSAGVRPLSAE